MSTSTFTLDLVVKTCYRVRMSRQSVIWLLENFMDDDEIEGLSDDQICDIINAEGWRFADQIEISEHHWFDERDRDIESVTAS